MQKVVRHLDNVYMIELAKDLDFLLSTVKLLGRHPGDIDLLGDKLLIAAFSLPYKPGASERPLPQFSHLQKPCAHYQRAVGSIFTTRGAGALECAAPTHAVLPTRILKLEPVQTPIPKHRARIGKMLA